MLPGKMARHELATLEHSQIRSLGQIVQRRPSVAAASAVVPSLPRRIHRCFTGLAAAWQQSGVRESQCSHGVKVRLLALGLAAWVAAYAWVYVANMRDQGSPPYW
jgi:hypothetical protein